jgi:hypothetical protein
MSLPDGVSDLLGSLEEINPTVSPTCTRKALAAPPPPL